MSARRSRGIASLFVAGALGLAGCQAAAEGPDAEGAPPPAVVEPGNDGGPARLVLVEEAVERLGLRTTPVTGVPGRLTIPYAAVVYDASGGTWVFVEVDARTYQRAPISVATITGDEVVLGNGPQPGTAVVTVAAAELVGVEAGISGGE